MRSQICSECHPALHSPLVASVHIPHKFGCMTASLALAVMTILSTPFFSLACEKVPQFMALMRARQIALAVQLYSSDHNGLYSDSIGDPETNRVYDGLATNANEAFANLFPTYCTSERLFYVSGSAYCNPELPDEIYGTSKTCLTLGENTYGYVLGLNAASDPAFPLIVDGTDGTGHYGSDKTRRGGVWAGKSAIVIRVDGSGEIANLAGPESARYIPRSAGDKTHNLLDPYYLNALHVRLLDPKMSGKW